MTDRPDALVIGGGPAGLMAADALLSDGYSVVLAEAKPSVGRKFLMAGKSGLNLTKVEDFDDFVQRYGDAAPVLRPILDAFRPDAVDAWAQSLAQPTFVGSTGRLFPKAMKASPLLRAWLARLEGMGIDRRTHWRWIGWEGEACRFRTQGEITAITPRVTVLALGGASWARLGSDGVWANILRKAGIDVTDFAPANTGLSVPWSAHMTAHFGAPLKNVTFVAGTRHARGEAVISAEGLEGGGLYPLSPALRGGASLRLDLAPDQTAAQLAKRLAAQRGKQSLSNRLRRAWGWSPAMLALFHECARPLPADPQALATLAKSLPVPHRGLRPMDEAISTAGGVALNGLDAGLMLRKRPGTFCCGEMLDWEAPTGGYLLTACLATGQWAGRHAARYLSKAAV
ncbi:TIGR03862 family flavoprotein [Thalassococcus sp. BH17M4-6]|uniref:TIGR03862 family flavoprotein n=1 Tax=Thalassococcus sp. BH17M4-6 TaxID=3413148 RepID=UPI003BE1BCD6